MKFILSFFHFTGMIYSRASRNGVWPVFASPFDMGPFFLRD